MNKVQREADITIESIPMWLCTCGKLSSAHDCPTCGRLRVDVLSDITVQPPSIPTGVMLFPSGASRQADVAGQKAKPCRFDLISPIALRRLAETYAEGAEKYGADNWKKGIPAANLLNHALAHVNAYLGGNRSEDHLAHAIWNLATAAHFEEEPAS